MKMRNPNFSRLHRGIPWLGFLGLVFLGWVDSALGFVPPSYYWARQIARKHEGMEQARLVYRLRIEGSSFVGDEILETKPDGSLSLLVKTPSGELVANHQGRWPTEGEQQFRGRLGILQALQFMPSPAGVFQALKASGLPLRTEGHLFEESSRQESTSSGPLFLEEEALEMIRTEGGQVVLRMKGPRSQLIVEKDSFLPLSWQGNLDGEEIEIRLSRYSPHGSAVLASKVEILKNGSPWVFGELQEVVLRPAKPTAVKAGAHGSAPSDLERYIELLR